MKMRRRFTFSTDARPRPWMAVAALAAIAVAGGCGERIRLGNIGDGGASVLWRATFEDGDLSEWSGDGNGGTYVENATGTPQASGERVHAGRYAGRTTVAPALGMLSFNYLFREAPSPPEVYYSAWHYVPSGIAVGGWLSLVHFRCSPTADGRNLFARWDLNVNQRLDGQLYAHLYDYVRQVNVEAPVPTPLPFDRWVHIEIFMRKAQGPTGRMTVWQDGVQLLDAPNVATTPNDWVEWSIGSASNDISPTPAVVYVDDAAISTSRVGPGT